MLLPGRNVGILIVLVVVFTSFIVAYPADDQKIDINIGFDLIRGPNGNPALRVASNKEDVQPRADDDSKDSAVDKEDDDDSKDSGDKKSEEKKPVHKKPKRTKSSEDEKEDEENDDENDDKAGRDVRERVTKGIMWDNENEPHSNKGRGGKHEDGDDEEEE